MSDERMAVMHEWLAEVCAELGLDPGVVRSTDEQLLALVGQVAHGPTRPGAPLTAFLVGLAVGAAGRELDTEATVRDVVERAEAVERLVAARTTR
ncbi:hypothetical protein SAMN05216184_104276 [Georgenia satyanarayanai]|uniref:DUF6457 domain-containing protein n=1 Tax=Georgenia satyanarayanai TaxID=860221 RepID=A0A2Y9A8K5_9MICO|nr:DUF6457 domain-containing protein [Georgenia satyanarayanai]PYG00334.1 hypothetical protein A8987_104276 [Georgenia satyanarayanai]SSA40720.1 hypothetical protein SAMN05216184_104276 [Georgenia satyanarayanai]